MTDQHEFRPNERFRVTALPPDVAWNAPDSRLSDFKSLSNGDIIVANDPPLYPSRACSDTVRKATVYKSVLHYGPYYIIPLEWIEPVSTSIPKVCECNVMVTGCTCGAFAEEQRRKT